MMRRASRVLHRVPRFFSREYSIRSSTADTPGPLHRGFEHWGENCFNTNAIREYVVDPEDIVTALDQKHSLTHEQSERFTKGLTKWAVERNCTHISHVFQPLSGKLGERHDFLFKIDQHGTATPNLTPETLRSTEPDASSFPNGGTRPTHQARGNAIWDPRSRITIAQLGECHTLRIPAILVGWNGNALDIKTPLLRSEQALEKSVLDLLRTLGDDSHSTVVADCGLEQEFFMVEERFFNGRPDLQMTGRTLIGRDPSRSQHHSDCYWGWQSTKMQDAIFDMEQEFWRVGIPNSTRHREVAPAQYEMAPHLEHTNQTNDTNLLMMHIMKEVAKRNEMAVLFHEKPFANINGSGKHLNWSVRSNQTKSFLRPESPMFLFITAALVRAVHLHADLLRASVATASNDHRLGGYEAPPGIISLFLGDEIYSVIEKLMRNEITENEFSVACGQSPEERYGVNYLPGFKKQTTDRNRTSPIVFCGNRIEFRAVGSSVNAGWAITVMNTIMAQSINHLNDKLASALKNGTPDAVRSVLNSLFAEHKDVVFNGDSYASDWVKEASSRGLHSAADTPEALKFLNTPKNRELFESTGVLSSVELDIRTDVSYQNFYYDVIVEARCLAELVNGHVLPSAYAQYNLLRDVKPAQEKLKELTYNIDALYPLLKKLQSIDDSMNHDMTYETRAEVIKNELRPTMQKIREVSDWIEGEVSANLWTLPTYGQILHTGH